MPVNKVQLIKYVSALHIIAMQNHAYICKSTITIKNFKFKKHIRILLNQVCTCHRLTCTWFIKIVSVQMSVCVCMYVCVFVCVCVCVCLLLRLLIASGMKWHDMDPIIMID